MGRKGNTVSKSTSIVTWVSVGGGKCLLSRCLETTLRVTWSILSFSRRILFIIHWIMMSCRLYSGGTHYLYLQGRLRRPNLNILNSPFTAGILGKAILLTFLSQKYTSCSSLKVICSPYVITCQILAECGLDLLIFCSLQNSLKARRRLFTNHVSIQRLELVCCNVFPFYWRDTDLAAKTSWSEHGKKPNLPLLLQTACNKFPVVVLNWVIIEEEILCLLLSFYVLYNCTRLGRILFSRELIEIT
jgi:hypothetical protein